MVEINVYFREYLFNIIKNDKNIGHLYNIKHPNSKYSIYDILDGILYVLKTGIAWRDSTSPVKWSSLFFHFKRFTKHNIFKQSFLNLRKNASSIKNTNVLIIDSTFISNKYGRDLIARNKFFKNKNCNKISIITDINGIPLSVLVKAGNHHDLFFVNDHLDDLCTINKNNKNKQILLADKGYESKIFRNSLDKQDVTLMVPKKSNMKISYKFDKILYKKRVRVEHAFQKLKIFRRVAVRYDALIDHFISFVYLAISFIIFKNI